MSPDKSNESNVVPDVSDTLFLKWCTRVIMKLVDESGVKNAR